MAHPVESNVQSTERYLQSSNNLTDLRVMRHQIVDGLGRSYPICMGDRVAPKMPRVLDQRGRVTADKNYLLGWKIKDRDRVTKNGSRKADIALIRDEWRLAL